MASLAPMLGRLGYDPYARQPKYGDPDRFVLHNEQKIANNAAGFNENFKKVYREKPFDKAPEAPGGNPNAGKPVPPENKEVFERDTNDRVPPLNRRDPRQYAREQRNRRREGPYPVPAW